MHWVVTEKDIFDRGKAEGRQEGILTGRQEGVETGIEKGTCETILATVSVLRKNGFSDEKIIGILVEDYKLSQDTAEQYVNGAENTN